MDYRETLNLPKTSFPMKANLARREPEWIRRWEEEKIYPRLIEMRNSSPIFSFHDGPPYANGHIHYGHILNKVLKDIIVKFKSMEGYLCRYIPGWDCHGLPIELAVERESGKIEDPIELRKKCRSYAERFIRIQMEEFKRLGTFATYETPYRTMDPVYEAVVIRALKSFVEKGAIYRSKMPIFWCIHCRTALALAEIEYEEHESDSIYVHFPVRDEKERNKLLDLCGISTWDGSVSVLIWTTTPWTLPANLAIAVHPDFNYGFLELTGRDGRRWLSIIAEDMEAQVQMRAEVRGRMVGRAVRGRELEGIRPTHPFEDRYSPFVLASYVTLDAGTGCVHTAPGHGVEDYQTGLEYGIAPFAPVDGDGNFTDEVKLWKGKNVFDANPLIVAHLDGEGYLLNQPGEKIVHSYPHCWRCKEPVIFRATSQWFISMDKTGIRKKAVEEIDTVKWIPAWGRDDIKGKVEGRPDWCISRQRVWGVPLPFVYCKKCGEPFLDGSLMEKTADIFSKDGSEAWFKRDVKDFLPDGFRCRRCGCMEAVKEMDIFDVWFESGVSWYAVSVQHNDQGFREGDPASGCVDLYLEGKDQHRGWFHTALLTAIGVRGRAPYRQVLTHGFVVDEEGRRYSKSKIEKLKASGHHSISYIPPEQIMNKYGAEILRLWVAYEDFRGDIAFSESILARLTESYRKIRNTFRFILGNISDFDPGQMEVGFSEMEFLDRWAVVRLDEYVRRVRKAYENYEFHRVYHETSYLMNVDLSSFYLDILKDRLYCEEAGSRLRTSAQTALWKIAVDVSRLLAPVLSFTSDEVWRHIPKKQAMSESVFLAGLPDVKGLAGQEEGRKLVETIDRLRQLSSEVNRALESARGEKLIGQSLEAKVNIGCPASTLGFLTGCKQWLSLEDFFIVSRVNLFESEKLSINVERADGKKCSRCWKYSVEGLKVKGSGDFVCPRCARILKKFNLL